MRTRRWLLAVVSGAALILVPGAAQSAAPTAAVRAATLTGGGSGDLDPDRQGASQSRPPQPSPGGSLCVPGTPPNAPQTTDFYAGDPLFGPAQLPTASPVGPLLAGYQRFGAQSQVEWVQNYTTQTTPNKLIFPPGNGFVLGPHGEQVKTRQTMLPGYRLDRFGFPGGAFLAPLGTPFSARSLAPQSLNTPANAPLANYHTYCVLKPFDVDSGPIAPWFAQTGLGTQFQLNAAYLPQAGGAVSVQWLLDHQFLTEEYLDGVCTTTSVPRQSSTPVPGYVC
ncbi:TNT domain-containing protein [Micromonospora mangrovi]|uniref:TNT domain-containing protein n=2 Tax=Micromonospora TaxID=1873 RepID=A0AAU8HD71_9ACTN